ncbi:hypothetical protein C8868_004889 [Salmonella enterica]|nr:hypothetical protein [Salmonella enterica]
MGYNVNVFIFVHIDADDDFHVPDWHVGQQRQQFNLSSDTRRHNYIFRLNQL